ncbi:MAG: hypothetical protein HN348_25855, partial [Proteobacteria bacterium]|nr:hypothetical protein [Pseudomonadota bacterium]
MTKRITKEQIASLRRSAPPEQLRNLAQGAPKELRSLFLKLADALEAPDAEKQMEALANEMSTKDPNMLQRELQRVMQSVAGSLGGLGERLSEVSQHLEETQAGSEQLEAMASELGDIGLDDVLVEQL